MFVTKFKKTNSVFHFVFFLQVKINLDLFLTCERTEISHSSQSILDELIVKS